MVQTQHESFEPRRSSAESDRVLQLLGPSGTQSSVSDIAQQLNVPLYAAQLGVSQLVRQGLAVVGQGGVTLTPGGEEAARVLEAQSAAMLVERAETDAIAENYGALTPEARRLVEHLARWGVARTDSLYRAVHLERSQMTKALKELDKLGWALHERRIAQITRAGRHAVAVSKRQTRRQRMGDPSGGSSGGIVSDDQVRRAVGRMQLRADRQPKLAQLAATFVDPGLLGRIDNSNNQIIYGRRGTGKTHVLHMLEAGMRSRERTLVAYIDFRRLGSGGLVEDRAGDIARRAIAIFKDLLESVQNEILGYATDPQTATSTARALSAIDELCKAITRTVMEDETVRHESRTSSSRDVGVEVGGGLTALPRVGGKFGRSHEVENTTGRAGRHVEHLRFSQLSSALERALEASAIDHLYVLLDEWSTIPPDLQPSLAEYVKRSFFAIPRVTVKIGALPYRSVFSERLPRNNVLGFELGADLASAVELDEYFVYDRNNAATETAFGEVLLRHLLTEIEIEELIEIFKTEHVGDVHESDIRECLWQHLEQSDTAHTYLADRYGVESADQLVEVLFSSKRAFRELVRAGEGVIRDFLSIFARAFFDSVSRNHPAIDLSSVRDAAREWFSTDKELNLDDDQRDAIDFIVSAVIGRHKARSFMVDVAHTQEPIIVSLYDFRLIHLVERGFTDAKDPGKRYSVYTLDYGLYVNLLDTKSAPAGDFTSSLKSNADAVPYSRGRYFRRVILNPREVRMSSRRQRVASG